MLKQVIELGRIPQMIQNENESGMFGVAVVIQQIDEPVVGESGQYAWKPTRKYTRRDVLVGDYTMRWVRLTFWNEGLQMLDGLRVGDLIIVSSMFQFERL